MRLREWTVEDAGERCGNVAVDIENGVGHVSGPFVAWTFAHHDVRDPVWPTVACQLTP
ncbi:hypothetical protein ACWEIJ_40610 [Lentzea sp. NPDC004789]